VQRAHDLAQLNVDIELFPLPVYTHQQPKFDVKAFFASIIAYDEDGDDDH